MEQPAFVLMGSVLLGPAAWRSVAELLRDAGREVIVLPHAEWAVPTSSAEAAALYLRGVPAGREVLLVPHSNAGMYVAGLVHSRRVAGVVFVDSGIPVSSGIQPLAGEALLEQIAPLADDSGLLAPWTTWWPEEFAAPLFPNAVSRASVESGQPRVPLAYLQDSLVVEPGWDGIPAAYLAFGPTYDDAQMDAAERGWPVVVLDGLHLHMLVNPQEVAGEILALSAGWGTDAVGGGS